MVIMQSIVNPAEDCTAMMAITQQAKGSAQCKHLLTLRNLATVLEYDALELCCIQQVQGFTTGFNRAAQRLNAW